MQLLSLPCTSVSKTRHSRCTRLNMRLEDWHGKSDTGFRAPVVCSWAWWVILAPGSVHPTALIPTWFGLALGLFGFLAISPDEGRRKLFMHINVTIGLLGFLGAAAEAVSRLCSCAARRGMRSGLQIALASQAHHGRAAADLRDSVRALVHRSAALGEGLAHGHDAAAEWAWAVRAERSPHGRGARAGAGGSAQEASRT